MAMNGNALGDAIKAALDALGPDPTKQAFWRAVGQSIVDHVKNNAVVTSTVAVTSVTGVTPGTGASGAGSGSATGTVS